MHIEERFECWVGDDDTFVVTHAMSLYYTIITYYMVSIGLVYMFVRDAYIKILSLSFVFGHVANVALQQLIEDAKPCAVQSSVYGNPCLETQLAAHFSAFVLSHMCVWNIRATWLLWIKLVVPLLYVAIIAILSNQATWCQALNGIALGTVLGASVPLLVKRYWQNDLMVLTHTRCAKWLGMHNTIIQQRTCGGGGGGGVVRRRRRTSSTRENVAANVVYFNRDAKLSL